MHAKTFVIGPCKGAVLKEYDDSSRRHQLRIRMPKAFQVIIMNSNSNGTVPRPDSVEPIGLPGRMHTELKEYSRRRGTEYPYNDNLDIDVLIVGAGFGKSILSHTRLRRLIISRWCFLFENSPRAGLESDYL